MSWSAKRWRIKPKFDGQGPDFCESCCPSPTNQTILRTCHRKCQLKLERRLHVTSRCSGSRNRPRRPIANSRASKRPRLLEGRRGHCDGAEWLSEVPWLSMVEDESTSKEPAQVVCEVTKKPVTERNIPMKRPAVAFETTEWHREHTRVYYLAKKEYETEVLAGEV